MARRKSMTFFAPDRGAANQHVKKIIDDYEIDTGRIMQGNLRKARNQKKHSSGWKTWEW